MYIDLCSATLLNSLISSGSFTYHHVITFFFFFKIHERESDSTVGKGQREREHLKQSALGVEPSAGFDLTTLRLPPNPKPIVGCSTDCTTQAPPLCYLLNNTVLPLPFQSSCLLFFLPDHTGQNF